MGIAVVTGASSGLGRELCSLLAARGERVVAIARNEASLESLAASSPRIEAVVADLSTPRGRQQASSAVDDVDILVNNAGLRCLRPLCRRAPGRDRRDGGGERRGAHRAHGAVASWDGRARERSGPQRGLHCGVPAGPLDGGVLRVQVVRAVAHRGAGRGAARVRRHCDRLLPGPFTSGFQAVAGIEDTKLVKGRKLPTSLDMSRAALSAMDRGTVVAVPGVTNKMGAIAPRFAPRPFVRRAVRWVQSQG